MIAYASGNVRTLTGFMTSLSLILWWLSKNYTIQEYLAALYVHFSLKLFNSSIYICQRLIIDCGFQIQHLLTCDEGFIKSILTVSVWLRWLIQVDHHLKAKNNSRLLAIFCPKISHLQILVKSLVLFRLLIVLITIITYIMHWHTYAMAFQCDFLLNWDGNPYQAQFSCVAAMK